MSDEKDDPKPSGVRGVWWHETLRALAAIKECVHPLSVLLYVGLRLTVILPFSYFPDIHFICFSFVTHSLGWCCCGPVSRSFLR